MSASSRIDNQCRIEANRLLKYQTFVEGTNRVHQTLGTNENSLFPFGFRLAAAENAYYNYIKPNSITASCPDHFCILQSQEVLETECRILMVEPYMEKLINWNHVWPRRDTELLKLYMKINLHGFDEVNEGSVGAWDRHKDALLPILVKGESYTVASPSISRAFLLYRRQYLCFCWAKVSRCKESWRRNRPRFPPFPCICSYFKKRGFKFAQLGYVPHCPLIATNSLWTKNRISQGPPPRLARRSY